MPDVDFTAAAITTALATRLAAENLGTEEGYTTPRKILEVGTVSVAYSATVTPNADTTRNLVIGALTGNLTIANPTGTPADCQPLRIRLKQDGTGGRTVAFGNAFRLPTGGSITVDLSANKTTRILAEWNATDSKWDITGNLGGY